MGTAVFSRLRDWFGARQRWRSVGAVVRAVLGRAAQGEDSHPFDRRYRTDTAGLLYADELVSGHDRDALSAGYYATAPSLFRGAVEMWKGTLAQSGARLEDYAFADLGCGKGRVLMMASEYPFRRVVGVELNPGLARVARRNLRRWMRRRRSCNEVEVIQDDVLAAPLPGGPLVLFFFNSFEREMVELLLDRLEAEAEGRRGPMDVIYVHPEFAGLVRRRAGVQVLAEGEIEFSAEDTAADVFGVGTDGCVVYRLGEAGPEAA